ncbi:MAG: carbon storage regulator CsrA [Candidatus Omnitrophica bacterium]|nr:carbon storage regulator CsrA [Candidatus Omnitrophota bacterium]
MLVLSRKTNESIMVGDNVEIKIVEVKGEYVKLGITAPRSIAVHRKEIYEAIKKENEAAAQTSHVDEAKIEEKLKGFQEKNKPTQEKDKPDKDNNGGKKT